MNDVEASDSLRELVQGDRLVCLTGAGISRALRRKSHPSKQLPSWLDLLSELSGKIRPQNKNHSRRSDWQDVNALLDTSGRAILSEDLIAAASILRTLAPSPERFDRWVRDLTTPELKQTTSVHRAIVNLQPRGIITWNYDDAHESSLNDEQRKIWKVLCFSDEEALARAIGDGIWTPFLLKAHGTITDKDSSGKGGSPDPLILTAESYRDIFVKRPAYRAFIQHIFTNFNLVIIGFGMADPDFDMVLERAFNEFGSPIQTHVLIRAESDRQQTVGQEVRLRRRYGIRTLYISGWGELEGVLIDATRTPGPSLRSAISDCIKHSKPEERSRAHRIFRKLGPSGKAFAKQILLDKLRSPNLLPDDESELAYSLGCVDGEDPEVRQFFLDLLQTRSNQPTKENVETIAHVLSVFEPGLTKADAEHLEHVVRLLSNWPDGLVDDRRLEKYAEAALCRLRARYELFDRPRLNEVRLHVTPKEPER